MWIGVHARYVCRFVAAFVPLLAQWSAWSQTPAWQAGVAKVTLRADLNRQPGTAFVVALEKGTAFLVTSAHVVEGDPNPQIEFVAAPRKPYPTTERNIQEADTYGLRGLALLVVNNPPSGLKVLPPSPVAPGQGDAVIVAGYPAPIREFTVADSTIGAISGEDLVLNRETGEGFSGGPVLRDGSVVGLVFGHKSGFGVAIQSADVRTYLKVRACCGVHNSSRRVRVRNKFPQMSAGSRR